MYAEVILPNLGFGMEEGRLINWLKQPGDIVHKGQPIAEVESDKATVELEATIDGVLDILLYPADSLVPVGAVIARINTGEITTPAEKPTNQVATVPVTPVAQRVAAEHGVNLASVVGSGSGGKITRRDVQSVIGGVAASGSTEIAPTGKVLAAPATRQFARDQHIDLRQVTGSGLAGRITRADVTAVIEQAKSITQTHVQPEPIKTAHTEQAEVAAGRHEIPLSKMRQTIARRLAQSAQEAPHFYVTAELDLTAALRQLPKAVGINTLLLYLTVRTLGTQPELNATYADGHLYQYDAVNLAIAVALPTGLITPVLHRANDYSLAGLADRMRDLINRTRDGRLGSEELSGGTFTVSNLGMVNQVTQFTAILNPPQVAILAIGAAKPRPFVIDGGLFVRQTVHLTLSADHRIIDGLLAARFLEAFDANLQAFSG